VYCKITEYFSNRWKKKSHEGRPEQMTDEEVLTVAIVGNLVGWQYENQILEKFKSLFPSWFKYLSQSRFNRRLQKLE